MTQHAKLLRLGRTQFKHFLFHAVHARAHLSKHCAKRSNLVTKRKNKNEQPFFTDNLVDPAIEENLLQPYLQRRLEASGKGGIQTTLETPSCPDVR